MGWHAILAPHIAQTEARMRQHPVILCLQDPPELDFNGQEFGGLGPLSYEAQRDFFATPERAGALPAQFVPVNSTALFPSGVR